MDQVKLKKTLYDTGCCNEEAESIIRLYECGDIKGALRKTRKDRCRLMDEYHENARKIDCMDFIIRIMEKEIKQAQDIKGGL